MYNMYRRPARSHARRNALITLAVICLALGGIGFAGYSYYRSNPELAGFLHETPTEAPRQTDQAIVESTPRIKQTGSETGPHVDRDLFSLDLPIEWSFGTYENEPYSVYNFVSSGNEKGMRGMKIYVDIIPEKQAVSRSVTVKPQGNRFTHGLASDRCTQLAKPDASGLTTYDGASFYCDISAKDPGTVGASAPGTPNKIRLTSLKSGLHDFYFLYTDTTPKPDYDLFYRMLNSFTVK